jgi:hypothetical protein
MEQARCLYCTHFTSDGWLWPLRSGNFVRHVQRDTDDDDVVHVEPPAVGRDPLAHKCVGKVFRGECSDHTPHVHVEHSIHNTQRLVGRGDGRSFRYDQYQSTTRQLPWPTRKWDSCSLACPLFENFFSENFLKKFRENFLGKNFEKIFWEKISRKFSEKNFRKIFLGRASRKIFVGWPQPLLWPQHLWSWLPAGSLARTCVLLLSRCGHLPRCLCP